VVVTAIASAALFGLAVALFLRELRLWRARLEIEGPVFRYSRRRFVRRTLGCTLLAVVAAMTFLGLEVLDFTGHLTAMQAYWAIVGTMCLGLLVIPFLDFRETYRHIAKGGAEEKLRREIDRLREERRDKRS
jgi:hypothetical protein